MIATLSKLSRFERESQPVWKAKRVICSTPLVNNRTLFSSEGLRNVIEFVRLRLEDEGQKMGSEITVRIKHLYFSKVVKSSWESAQRAQQIFTPHAKVTPDVQVRNDRSDELFLNICMHGINFRVYDYRRSIHLSTSGIMAGEGHGPKCGRFKKEHYVEWQTCLSDFMKFIELTEEAFLEQGTTHSLEAFLEICLTEKVSIRIGVSQELLPVSIMYVAAQNSEEYEWSSYYGVVPAPVEEIIFR